MGSLRATIQHPTNQLTCGWGAVSKAETINLSLASYRSRPSPTLLDTVRLPTAISTTTTALRPSSSSVDQFRSCSPCTGERQAIVARHSSRSAFSPVHQSLPSRAKARWPLAINSRPASSQPASCDISMSLRDDRPITNDPLPQRLDDLLRPKRRLPPSRHSSVASTVPRRLYWRPDVSVYRTNVRPKASLQSFHKTNAPFSASVQSTQHPCTPVPRRLSSHHQSTSCISASDEQRPSTSSNAGPRAKLEKVCVTANTVPYTPRLRGQHINNDLCGSNQESSSIKVRGSCVDKVCYSSSQVGLESALSKLDRPTHVSSTSNTFSKDSCPQSLSGHVVNCGLAWRCSIREPSPERSSVDPQSTANRHVHVDVTTTANNNSLHRRVGHCLGSDFVHRRGSRLLLSRGNSPPYHMERTPVGYSSSSTPWAHIPGLKHPTHDGQHDYNGHHEQGDLEIPCVNGGVPHYSPTSLTVQGRYHSQLYQHRAQRSCRLSVQNDREVRVGAVRPAVPTASGRPGRVHRRPLRFCENEKVQTLQLPRSVPRQLRGRIRRTLDRPQQLDQSSIRSHPPYYRKTSAGESGRSTSRALLALPTLVAGSISPEHLHSSTISQRHSSSSDLPLAVYTRAATEPTMETGLCRRTILVRSAAELLAGSLRPSTRNSYAHSVSVYSDLCLSIGCVSFPVTSLTASCFVSLLKERRYVPSSISQAWSAVKKQNYLLGFAQVSDEISTLVSQLIRGVSNSISLTSRPKPPPDVFPSRVVCELLPVLSSQLDSREIRQQSQLAAVIFCFLFCLRSDTLVYVLLEDISFDQSFLIFLERKRKNMSVLSTRSVRAPLSASPVLLLLRYYKWLVAQGVALSAPLFNFDSFSSSSALLSRAIELSLSLLPVIATSGVPTSSHSLRRGAAVAMTAVSVPTTRILQWGAWASVTSLQPYLRGHAFVTPSQSDLVFFGWMVNI